MERIISPPLGNANGTGKKRGASACFCLVLFHPHALALELLEFGAGRRILGEVKRPEQNGLSNFAAVAAT